MSDGDNATLGRRAAPEPPGDDDAQPHAATWERWPAPQPGAPAAPRRGGARRRAVTPGSGSEGTGVLTVADLIAKVGGTALPDSSTGSRHRHLDLNPDPEPAPEPTPQPASEPREVRRELEAAEPDLWDHNEISGAVYSSELPDLDEVCRRHDDDYDDYAGSTDDYSDHAGSTDDYSDSAGPTNGYDDYVGSTNDYDDYAASTNGYAGPTNGYDGDAGADGEPADFESASERTDLLPVLTSRRLPMPDRERSPAKSSDSTPARRARRPLLLAGRTAVALMAVLALVLTGGAWQWSSSKNNHLNQVSALDPDSHDIRDPSGQYGDENFLIVGVDSRAGANSEVGAGDTDDAAGARSDTIMLVNIPANRKRVVAVSFPRDLAVTPLKCVPWNSDSGAYGPRYYEDSGTYGDDTEYTGTKLNSTYAIGGPKCLVKEIQKLSGLFINRFMAVDFVGFGKMVDALGGVEVCSTGPIQDYELGTVLAHGGRQMVDGPAALNYVRARKVTTEYNGDYGRIKRQQLFLSSLLRALISKDTFMSPTKLNNVVDMFISDSQVDGIKTKDLVSLGQSLQGLSAGHITFVTVPTGETDENGDEPPRTADMRSLFDAIINDDPLPGESDQNATPTSKSTQSTQAAGPTASASASATPTTTPVVQMHSEEVQTVTTAPDDVTVRVSNATGESGLAASASDKLEQHGFNVMTPDDYPDTLNSTTVLFSPGNEQAAATVASALANAPIQRVTGSTLGQVVQVVLGPDFRSVKAPAPSGSSISVQLTRSTSSTPTELPDDLTVTNAADTTCE